MRKTILALCTTLTLVGCKKDAKTNNTPTPLPQAAAAAKTPEEVIGLYQAASKNKDGAALWDLTCAEGKKFMETTTPRPSQFATQLGLTQAEIDKMPARDLFIKLTAKTEYKEFSAPTDIKTEAIDDTKSKVIFKSTSDSTEFRCEMVTCKESDGWRYDSQTCEGGG